MKYEKIKALEEGEDEFNDDEFDYWKSLQMKTKVNGITLCNPAIAETLTEDDKIKLEREPDNKYDANAVKVMVLDAGEYKHIGYIPKEDAPVVSTAVLNGEDLYPQISACGISNSRPYCRLTIFGLEK